MRVYTIIKKSKISSARYGKLKTAHGVIETPFFMPIATRGAVKSLSAGDLKNLGSEIILSNTYHLMLKPGETLIKRTGGLHKFMNWQGPILTDSGGFQIFSLSKIRKIEEKGVMFNSTIDGKKYFLTPEKAIKIQEDLGSDIMMVLDECTPYPCDYEYAKKSEEMTFRWAKRCKEARVNKKQLLFGIVQGSVYKDLRIKSSRQITGLDFDGYAVGGLAVGEPEKKMYQILDYTVPYLPEDNPHYLMGAGKPEQIIEAVKRGIDMFDCVIPTREARHSRLYLWRGNPGETPLRWRVVSRGKGDIAKKNFYKIINISSAKFQSDFSSVNNTNLKNYSKAYLHHLFKTKEPLAMNLASLNNLGFYLDLMEKIRIGIKTGKI